MAGKSGKQNTAARQDTSIPRRNPAPAHLDAAAEAERLREFLRPTVERHKLLLEDVEVRIVGSHRTLHVVVDLPDDGVDGVSLDTVSEVSQSVSNALDNDPGDDGRPYNLEVSSPGVSRPLTQPRHWRRNIGRLVDVRLVDGEVLEGRLIDADETSVSLKPLMTVKKGTKPKFGEDRAIPYDKIRKGTVQVEFAHADAEESGGNND
ncbi:ribosome maturation factor RimP [Arthrobacter sp. EH-1B-1]|uniref:Ribosome maturation factor RimP n=1 Tax=Arthrobacter vasquezii TaxID=2977629 RepID=A0ABT6CXN0_9MICC|nr:ribosome maturation factor RimP [Arthrobacter vasquezii]MDF9278830.1 ribosome maturation factor RimP [Arthrobacter vasquezii]